MRSGVDFGSDSGIYRYFRDVFEIKFMHKKIVKTKILKKPTISGNIVIILILLFTALAVSALCFGIEIYLHYPCPISSFVSWLCRRCWWE